MCVNSSQGARSKSVRKKGWRNILKHNDRNSNSKHPYWKHKNPPNCRWILPLGGLSENIKPPTQIVFDLRERPMLCPERHKIRLGVHKCLGSRRPILCPERNKLRSGFHKCLGSRRSMLCPERHKIRLGFHKCLGSRRTVLCPEQAKIRSGVHKCLGARKPMLCPK